ncbi:hypothetical protein NDU88_001436 [Pleurodeles waltl]|uniref:Reverse transcriptase domain-containing protein n=1 Tax=Pleurodeles waltl TaxID=8319 RepID=A0AAV7U768_PLEWA|nr:hypothetical protein NDU88_001436 [Pleurodeles waltl]
MVDELRQFPDQGDSAAIILLHFNAAFDTVDHAVLTQRLSIPGRLDGRFPAVNSGVLSGIPEDTVDGLIGLWRAAEDIGVDIGIKYRNSRILPDLLVFFPHRISHNLATSRERINTNRTYVYLP